MTAKKALPMTVKKVLPHPADKLLSILDSTAEDEKYTLDDMENLSLAAIKDRLRDFDLTSSAPLNVAGFLGVAHAADKGALAANDVPQVETLPLRDVEAELDRMGMDYRAGFEHLQLLIGRDSEGCGSSFREEPNKASVAGAPPDTERPHRKLASLLGFGRAIVVATISGAILYTILQNQIAELRKDDGIIVQDIAKLERKVERQFRYNLNNHDLTNPETSRVNWEVFLLPRPQFHYDPPPVLTGDFFVGGRETKPRDTQVRRAEIGRETAPDRKIQLSYKQ